MREDFKLALADMLSLVGKLRVKHNKMIMGADKNAMPYSSQLLQVVPLMRAFIGMSQGSDVGAALYVKRYEALCAAMAAAPHARAWSVSPEGYSILACRVPVPSHSAVYEWEMQSLQQLYAQVVAESQARRFAHAKKVQNHEASIVEFVRALSESQKAELSRIFNESLELGFGRLVLNPTVLEKAK